MFVIERGEWGECFDLSCFFLVFLMISIFCVYRARGESAVFVLDPETSECLHYEHLQGYPAKKGINIPREILAAHSELDIRNDLLDCSIDVCSVEVRPSVCPFVICCVCFCFSNFFSLLSNTSMT